MDVYGKVGIYGYVWNIWKLQYVGMVKSVIARVAAPSDKIQAIAL